MTPVHAAYLFALDLCRRYAEGATIEGMAEETGLSYRRVRETLLTFGMVLRPPMIQVPPCPPGMVNAYKHGVSIRQLAARYGHSYNQTRNMLLHEGVRLRRRGQPS